MTTELSVLLKEIISADSVSGFPPEAEAIKAARAFMEVDIAEDDPERPRLCRMSALYLCIRLLQAESAALM